MGIVFSPEAIMDSRVPEPDAHVVAGRTILNEFFEPHGDLSEEQLTWYSLDGNGIHSGLVYGSTALGTAGLRSDVDVLINYHANQSTQVLSLVRGVFSAVEREHNVPIEAQILPVGSLYSPLEHNIDPLFAQHLLTIQNNEDPRWSYNWPADALEFQLLGEDDQNHVKTIAIRYASGKSRQFTRALVGYRGEPDLQVFQRALELPSAIGRKVIVATLENGEVSPDTGDKSAMLTSALDKLEQLTPEYFKRAVSYQRWLIDLDASYDEILRSTIGGETTISQYNYWLKSSYPHAIQMAQEVAYVWSQIIFHHIDTPEERASIEASQTFNWGDLDVY